MKHHTRKLFIIAACAFALSACETTGTKDEDTSGDVTVEDRTTGAPGTGDDAASSGVAAPGTWEGDPLDNPDSLLATRVVYFEFDSADVSPADRATIEAHAAYLAQNPGATVSLEGHADERGSREYNMALGERRAEAVRRLQSLMGASDQQIRTVSYGEERPAVLGHDESSWAQNRRVEIVYVSR